MDMVSKYVLVSALSAGAGYFLAQKRLQNRYADLYRKESEESRAYHKAFYEKKLKKQLDEAKAQTQDNVQVFKDAVAEVEQIHQAKAEAVVADLVAPPEVLEAAEAMKNYRGYSQPAEPTQAATGNLVVEETEVKPEPAVRRLPYIIGVDEYMTPTMEGQEQVSLTYFADGILANDSDETFDVEWNVGKDNLQFGAQSNDKNAVYVRNEKLKKDFEVVRLSLAFDATPPG